MSSNPRIIEFCSGAEPDHRGRYLGDIQRWPDERLEEVHDYIQWLFPLPEPSGFNLAAPVLTAESIQEFQTRPELRQNLRMSFLRMLSFYGLEVRVAEPVTVTRSTTFASKAALWLLPGNHNHLRIRRILRCLSILGLRPEAKAFFECLLDIYRGNKTSHSIPAISDETFEHWTEAVTN
jgi:hypothetical protein